MFKLGDKIRRISGRTDHLLQLNGIYIVEKCDGNVVYIKGSPFAYSVNNFKKV